MAPSKAITRPCALFYPEDGAVISAKSSREEKKDNSDGNDGNDTDSDDDDDGDLEDASDDEPDAATGGSQPPNKLTPEELHKQHIMNGYLQDFFMGRGFCTVLQPPYQPPKDDLAPQLANPSLEPRSLMPPRIDFFDGPNRSYLDAILSELRPATRARFEKYLKFVVLGIVGIFGFAGSGKTETLAITSLVYLANPLINKIYVSAPTHVAVSNIASRIHQVGARVVKSLPASVSGTIPLVVHGHNFNTEINAFIAMASDSTLSGPPVDPWRPVCWVAHLSPCEWLLKVVKSGKFDLDSRDKS